MSLPSLWTFNQVNISTETNEPEEKAASTNNFQAGGTCEANYEGSQAWYPGDLLPSFPLPPLNFLQRPWHTGVIDSTQPGPTGELVYKVAFLTFGNSETLPADKLRPLQEPFEQHVEPTKLQVRTKKLFLSLL